MFVPLPPSQPAMIETLAMPVTPPPAPPIRAAGRAAARPTGVGHGFRPEHFTALRQDSRAGRPLPGFLEIRASRPLAEGSPPQAMLMLLRAEMALSLHLDALPLPGSAAGLRALGERYRAAQVTVAVPAPAPVAGEAWPRDPEARLRLMLLRLVALQEGLDVPVLLELSAADLPLAPALVAGSGCGLVLGTGAVQQAALAAGQPLPGWLDGFGAALPAGAVAGLHVDDLVPSTAADLYAEDDAGAAAGSGPAPATDPAWAVLAALAARLGPLPTLVGRDAGFVPYAGLRAQAARATQALGARAEAPAAGALAPRA